MDHIRFLAFLRAVESEAAGLGYYGDVLTDANVIPLVGTQRQQFDQCTIYVDVRPRPRNEAESPIGQAADSGCGTYVANY